MDFTLTFSPELEKFRDEVSAWLDQNNPKIKVTSDPREHTDEEHHRQLAFRKSLGDKGWLYPIGPKAYGGGGLTVDHGVVLAQEMDKRQIYGAGGGDSLPASCVMVWGTEEQKQKFVVPILKGEKSSWLLLTEPQGGSDLASARTRALRDGDDYVVNGQKIFVGNDHVPEYLFTIVNTDPEGARHRNLSYLMIPSDLPGVNVQPFQLLSGNPGYADRNVEDHKNMVFFDDVRVPAANLIGGHNEGWKVAATNMELEHGGGGRIISDLNFIKLIQAAKEEYEWGGRPLIEDEGTRDEIGKVTVMREILRLWGTRGYWLRHGKVRAEHEGPQYNYWLKSRAHPFAQGLQDVLGLYSLMRDPKYMALDGYLELYQRSVFATVHGAGGLNIQATVIARRLGVGRNTREEAGQLPGQD